MVFLLLIQGGSSPREKNLFMMMVRMCQYQEAMRTQQDYVLPYPSPHTTPVAVSLSDILGLPDRLMQPQRDFFKTWEITIN